MKKLRFELPFLESFLNGIRPSIWDLKWFLEINDPIDYALTPPSSVDYGFINCSNFEDTCILLEIYGKILKNTNPVALQLACETGKLYEYASGLSKWRSGGQT